MGGAWERGYSLSRSFCVHSTTSIYIQTTSHESPLQSPKKSMPGRKSLVPHNKTSIPFVPRMGGIHSEKKNQAELNNSQLDHHKAKGTTTQANHCACVPELSVASVYMSCT